MELKNICHRVNFFKQCREYNLSIWQCPSFLFLLIGVVTILSMIATYFVALKYAQPEIVALIVIGVSMFLVTIGYLVTKGFEDLAQINRLKTEFVSIASHQLRTPLTGIGWTIDLIRKTKNISKEEMMERLNEIEEGNQRMVRLVNDLLDVARVEQGRINLKPKKVFLDEIARELIEEYKALAKASNVKLVLQKETDIPLIKIDPQGIGLVLRNLIDNAIKYTQGGGVVRVKLSHQKNKIVCEVQDEGVGIPKKDQRNIFHKFFRSQNIMKYQTVGSGLGLFIAKAVIQESGGEIDFYSQEGKGTTFWFELPTKS